MRILVTGAAGFIGFHLSKSLLELGHEIIGADNLNDYYDVNLKKSRLDILNYYERFLFNKLDIIHSEELDNLFKNQGFDIVFHLAAQAGVRYSIENPKTYIESNIIGTFNILELVRKYPKTRLYYASSSSVYGNSEDIPFSTEQRTDDPVSLYAATKKSTEILAQSYANLYGLSLTGLRFFTVYGPWGRPDMAYYSFTKKIYSGEPINVFNNGVLERDFTYIDDIVNALIKLMEYDMKKGEINKHRIYNIGNNKPVALLDFIKILEVNIGIKAKMNMIEMQKGDVLKTFADIGPLKQLLGFSPTTDLNMGLREFVKWYKDYSEYGE
jgi:UDP-glucuronate 4-epimerase